MADFGDTKYKDKIVGTKDDDTIWVSLGKKDTVDGRGGFDALTINYVWFPGQTTNAGTISIAGGVLSGEISGGSQGSVAFKNVESLKYYGTSGNEQFLLHLGNSGVAASYLDLDAGSGAGDRITIDAYDLIKPLEMTTSGAVTTSNIGTFRNWEAFDITVSGHLDNDITLGAGDDVITAVRSSGGYDGGDGIDTWNGDYSGDSAAQTFDYLLVNHFGRVGNNESYIDNTERFNLLFGSGGDDVNFDTDGSVTGTFSGGGGYDQLGLAFTDADGAVSTGVNSLSDGSFFVATAFDGQYVATASGFEEVFVFGTSHEANTYTVNGATYAFAAGTKVDLQGDTPYLDTVLLDLRGQGSTTLSSDAGIAYALTATGARFNLRVIDEVTALLGAGGDTVDAGRMGKLTVNGGGGQDTITYLNAGVGVTVSLAVTGQQWTGFAYQTITGGFETLAGSIYGDKLTGGGDSTVETLRGYGSDDVLEGLGGFDTLDGGSGLDTASYAGAASYVEVSLAVSGYQDTKGEGQDSLISIENLIGSAYDDTLTGSSGNNVLTGGLGTDILTGGGGFDRFVFRATGESVNEFLESDLIQDFASGDKIDLAAIDANVFATGNQAFTVISGAFTGVAGQLRIEDFGSGVYYVSGDVNADKTADFGIYVQAGAAPVAGDFVL